MKQNKYDDAIFFEKYSKMERSVKGLSGAGEWTTLEHMLPDFAGKRVLDLGCGYGWHCQYASDHGAKSVTGVDISEKMLAAAKDKTSGSITYIHQPIEDVSFPDDSFDVVLSSLALHYIESFSDIVSKVGKLLIKDGYFIFSVEHPVFTADGPQDWCYDKDGKILHYPVDHYFSEGERQANFLGEPVMKYHRTLTTYLGGLIKGGFEITDVQEPMPSQFLLDTVEGMKEELRRPMMLIVSARKK